MKRIVLASVLLTGSLYAQDLSETWRQLSQYRAVSGVKAGVTGIGAVQSAYTAWVFGRVTMSHLQDARPFFSWSQASYDKWNDIIGCGAAVFGLLYATSKLGWEYFPEYVKHALKI
jgi:hypothetical protein